MFVCKGKQWGIMLFFSLIGGSCMRGAVPPLEHSLSGQSELVHNNIASFLSTKDRVQLAHSCRLFHSFFKQELADLEKEFDHEQFLINNAWKMEIEQQDGRAAAHNFDAFKRTVEAQVQSQKEGCGVELLLNQCYEAGIGRLITELDAIIKKHKCEIVKLRMDYNDLTEVPQEIRQLHYLKSLTFGPRNPLRYQAGMFKGLPPIKELSLVSTRLARIPEGLFEGLSHVSVLTLYNNNLTEFSSDDIKPLVALTAINLRANRELVRLRLADDLAQQFQRLVRIEIGGCTAEQNVESWLNPNLRGQFVFKKDILRPQEKMPRPRLEKVVP